MAAYIWNADKIRFMLDAERYEREHNNNFYESMAAIIAQTLKPDAYVCDAGCGLGFLSCALSKYCRHVDAVDISEQALNAVKHTAPNNVSLKCMDMELYAPQEPLDALVFSLFGSAKDMLRWAGGLLASDGMLYMIVKKAGVHRFSVDKIPLERFTQSELVNSLLQRKIPYLETELPLELGQPFRSKEDAALFFRVYSHDKNSHCISFDSICDRLVETFDAEFPLYLPPQKRLTLIQVSAGDLINI